MCPLMPCMRKWKEFIVRCWPVLDLLCEGNHEVMDRIVERPLEKEEIDFEEVQETFLICGCQRPAATAPLDQDVDQPQDQIEEIPAAAEVLS